MCVKSCSCVKTRSERLQHTQARFYEAHVHSNSELYITNTHTINPSRLKPCYLYFHILAGMFSSPVSRTTASFLLLSYFTHTLAQSDVLSCANVSCPILNNSAVADCTVAGARYSVIGLVTPSSPSNSSLVWTIGVNQTLLQNASPTTDIIDRAFYLGIDSSSVLTSGTINACSFFFTGSDGGPVFYDPVPGDCVAQTGSGFSGECVDALKRTVGDLSMSDDPTCTSIATALQDDLPPSCALSSSISITAVPLTGDKAPQPITAAQNQSSNCWPTLPKSNDLIPVFSSRIYTSYTNGTSITTFSGTNPVMSLFFGDGDDSPTSELVCLHPIAQNEASIRTTSPNGARESNVSSSWLVALLLVTSASAVLV